MKGRPTQRSWWRRTLALLLLVSGAQAVEPVWRAGWYPQPPLQFSVTPDEVENLTGLDVEVIRVVAREAGWRVQFAEARWDRQLEDLRSGRREIAFGAIETPEATAFARFSEPYRQMENSLYLRARDLDRHPFSDVASFLALVRARHLRLGIVQGRPPVLAAVRAFVADPENATSVVLMETDTQNLTALVIGEIDFALTDRFVAATLTTQLGYEKFLAEHAVRFGTAEVKVMFSRASTTEADLANFNQALRVARETDAFDHILHGYLLPPLLDIAIASHWFHWLDLIGTAAFALSGVILAHQGRYNLVGAFVLSALPAVGGGILRDLVTGRKPVGVLRSPTPLVIVVGVVVTGYVFFKLWDRAPKHPGKIAGVFAALCGFFDTVGLAAFTVIGVRVAVETHCDPLWLWGPLLAVLTGAGGGIMRDIVRADFHNPTLKRGFYAEVALVWALALGLFLELEVRRMGVDQVRYGVLAVLAGAFVTRLAILYRGWENPLQFGSRHTAPQRRLDVLVATVRAQAADWPAWFEEPVGTTQPRAREEIEKRHGRARREFAAARAELDELALEQLTPEVAAHVAAFRRELALLVAAEEALYDLVLEPVFGAEPARRVQQAVFASAAALGALATEGGQSAEQRATLVALTQDRAEALEAMRQRLAAASDQVPAPERARMLQFTVRFERLMQLLHDANLTAQTPS